MKSPALLQKFASFVRPRAPQRILVADDHQGVRDLSAEILRAEGYDVETAADGERALFKLAFEPFDLLVTDWKMPHLDGVTLVKWLRATGHRLPVVMLSGSDLGGKEVAAIRTELVAILGKPAPASHLLAAVRSALGYRPESPAPVAVTPALEPRHA